LLPEAVVTGRVTRGGEEEDEEGGGGEAKSARLTATRPTTVLAAEEKLPEARLPAPDAAVVVSSPPTARSRVSHLLSKGPTEPGLATEPSCFFGFV
jgi:hypothetical protein